MFKFKNVMIAAAAVVSLAAPGFAYASQIGQELKELRSDLRDQRDQVHDLRAAFRSGTSGMSRQQYRSMLADLRAQIGETLSDIQDLRDERASH